MDDLTVVENVFSGGENFDRPLSPHPNVAVKQTQETQDVRDIVAARRLNSFSQYLESVSDEETIQIIFLHIAHAVHHIHEQGWSHGRIAMENLRISESRRKVVLVQPIENLDRNRSGASLENKEHERKLDMSDDIKDLGFLFHQILKQKNISDEISANLLKSIKKDDFTSEKVLQHPYFWSTARKLSFLAAVAQRSKEKTKVGDKLKPTKRAVELKSLLDDDARSPSSSYSVGWIDKLAVTKKSRTEGNNGRTVGKDEIIKLANDTTHTTYDKDKLCSLVNFIRNHWEHFWELSDNVRKCFNSDPFEGYWQFFNTRFPNLFIDVYKIVKRMQTTKHKNKQMEEVYYRPLALNQDLP